MNKQQFEKWLFLPQPKQEELKHEPITNKRFILMVLLGIGISILCHIIGELTK
jgi:hypothetical protein